MTATDDRPVHFTPRGGRPIPYALTDAAKAALAVWPANRIEHEPKPGGCDGRGCRCIAGRKAEQ